MTDERMSLWPYGKMVAIVAIPVTWAAFAILYFLTRKYLDWPGSDLVRPYVYLALGASALPPVLLMLDFVASRGGVIGTKWFKVDFGKAVLDQPDVRRESFALPDNIVTPGEMITDSGGMKIASVLKATVANEIVCLDLKDGTSWWVTRLMALCAGALRTGSPKAIVFIGRKENVDGRFLGWGKPAALWSALLNVNPEYHARYTKANMIAAQLSIFGPGELLPRLSSEPAGQTLTLNPEVMNHLHYYDRSEVATLVKLLIGQFSGGVGLSNSPRNLEDPPDHLTLGRLNQLFEHCLYRDAIERSWPNEKQIAAFLESHAPYVALLKNGKYESMLEREAGSRAIIHQLFLRSHQRPRD